MVSLALLLLSCAASPGAGDPTSPEPTAPDTSTPSPDPDVEAPAAPSPPDLAQVQEGLAQLVARSRALDPWTVSVVHDHTLAAAADGCPALSEFNGQDYWSDDCETAAGVAFQGWSLSARLDQMVLSDGRTASDHFHLTGAMQVAWPDQGTVDLFGDVWATQVDRAEGQPGTLDLELSGRFRTDRADQQDTWLALDTDVRAAIATEDDGLARKWSADLRLAWQAEGLGAAVIEGLVVRADGDGCTVEGQPWRLWWADAGWVEVSLAAVDGAGCTACGPAVADPAGAAAQLGEACVDLGPLVDWTGAPW